MKKESRNESSIDKRYVTDKEEIEDETNNEELGEGNNELAEKSSTIDEIKKRHKCKYCSKTIKRLDHFRLHVNAHLARKKRKQSHPHRHTESDNEGEDRELSADSDESKSHNQKGRPILKVNLFAKSAKLNTLKAKAREKSPQHLEQYPNIKIVKIDLDSESELDEPLALKYVLLKDALYLANDI